MISRTLLTALSVSRTGVVFGAGTASGVGVVVVVVVTVLVAMNGNLLGKRLPFECTAGQAEITLFFRCI
jgi:hypothetical protein